MLLMRCLTTIVPKLGTSAVKAEISFPNTNPSSIPSGNWIEGTINLQGTINQNGIDWIMRAAHALHPNGVHGVVADVWKDCEGPALRCGFPAYATELLALVLQIYGLSASQPIYVEMKFANGQLIWLYSYDGSTWHQYDSWTPPSAFYQKFNLGTYCCTISGPYYTAYYYQFGMWTQSQFSTSIFFNVKIQNPSFYQSGAWHTVSTAESMQGTYTYFDQTWTYANSGWLFINANVPQSSPD